MLAAEGGFIVACLRMGISRFLNGLRNKIGVAKAEGALATVAILGTLAERGARGFRVRFYSGGCILSRA
jgi:hypothetical protein